VALRDLVPGAELAPAAWTTEEWVDRFVRHIGSVMDLYPGWCRPSSTTWPARQPAVLSTNPQRRYPRVAPAGDLVIIG